VNRNYRLTSSGWAIIVLGAAALALGGCGRKGALDLPPTATAQPAAASEPEQTSKPSVFDPSYGADGAPVASKGRKRPFVLDPLLND
jgi:predicted small lipoprotein YifL